MVRFFLAMAFGFICFPADADPAGNPPLQDLVTNEYANFSHWSGVLDLGNNITELGYAVCNLGPTTPLIFEWPQAHLQLGPGGLLPVNHCSTLHRPVAAFDKDLDAVIHYTQAGRTGPAAAYVRRIFKPVSNDWLPPSVRNILETAIHGNDQLQPELASLQIEQTRSTNEVIHKISWTPPSVVLIVNAEAFGGSAESAVNQINKTGYQASLSRLDETSFDFKNSGISSQRSSSQVITVTHAKSSDPLTFSTSEETGSIADFNVTLVHLPEKQLIVDAEFGLFSK